MCVFSGAKGVGSSAQTHARKTIIMMMMAAAAAAAVVLVAPKAQLYQLFRLIDLAHSAAPLSMYVCVCVYALCSTVMLNECQTISRALTKIKPTQFWRTHGNQVQKHGLTANCTQSDISLGVEGDVGGLGWIQIFVGGGWG